MMSLRYPDFLLIGAMKGGTTSIWSALRAHPGVYLPPTKEPTTLVHEDVTCRVGARRYAQFFADAPPGTRCGEASTGYTKHPQSRVAASRARQLLGSELRLLYSVRHPLDRAVSHWMHALRLGQMPQQFDAAIQQHPELVDIGRYAYQLQPWLDHFDERQFKIVAIEDVVARPQDEMNAVAAFLGVECTPDWRWAMDRSNAADTVRAPAQSILGRAAQYLRRQYRVKAFLRPKLPDRVIHLANRLTTGAMPPVPQPTAAELERAWARIVERGADRAHLPGAHYTWQLGDSRQYAGWQSPAGTQ